MLGFLTIEFSEANFVLLIAKLFTDNVQMNTRIADLMIFIFLNLNLNANTNPYLIIFIKFPIVKL